MSGISVLYIMILGIGIDICAISRMEKAITRRGERFIDHIFHPVEVEYAFRYKNPYPYFAARFAAKEAFLKCFKMGIFSNDIALNEIVVHRSAEGAPYIVIENSDFKIKCSNLNIFLSISHDKDSAVASVVIEKA